MGLRPTQGMKMALVQQPLFMEASPSPLSSRAKPRDLRFISCHPQFLLLPSAINFADAPPLDKSGDRIHIYLSS